jgi:hypothetical protein
MSKKKVTDKAPKPKEVLNQKQLWLKIRSNVKKT